MIEICVLMAIAFFLFGGFLTIVAIASTGSTRNLGPCKVIGSAGLFLILLGALIGYVTWLEIEDSTHAKNVRAEADLRIIR